MKLEEDIRKKLKTLQFQFDLVYKSPEEADLVMAKAEIISSIE
jgi:hypothetical protein